MSIDFSKWTEEFGGQQAVEDLKKAADNEYTELPEGTYRCKLEKLELGETKDHKPMIKGMFRIIEGPYKKQCLFYNQVFCRSANGNAFSMYKGLEFLRSLQIFDDSEVDFSGDYAAFNDLLLDMAEEAEGAGMSFDISKEIDGQYTRLEVAEVY